MRKYLAYAMAVAAFAGTLSVSDVSSAAESLIKPVDPTPIRPVVEEEGCHDKKSYQRTFFNFGGEQTTRRGRHRD